jgi:hypothetical protein
VALKKCSDCGARVSKPKRRKAALSYGTFEPWLAGDRQKEKRVAKARYPLKSVRFEVSLS